MDKIHYYWTESKEDLEKIENILIVNEITYELKVEKIKLSIKNEIHHVNKIVYVILIEKRQRDLADSIITKVSNFVVEPCESKRIYSNSNDKKEDSLKSVEIIIALLIFIVAFFPIGLFENKISNILLCGKLLVIFYFLFKVTKTIY